MALWEPPPQDTQEVKSELFILAIFHRKWSMQVWKTKHNSETVDQTSPLLWTWTTAVCLLKSLMAISEQYCAQLIHWKKSICSFSHQLHAPVQYHKADVLPLHKKQRGSPFNMLTVCTGTAPPEAKLTLGVGSSYSKTTTKKIKTEENFTGGIALKSNAFHLCSCLKYFHDPVHIVQINTYFMQALQLRTGVRIWLVSRFGHKLNMYLFLQLYTAKLVDIRTFSGFFFFYICILKKSIKLYKIWPTYFSSNMRKPIKLFFLEATECNTQVLLLLAQCHKSYSWDDLFMEIF